MMEQIFDYRIIACRLILQAIVVMVRTVGYYATSIIGVPKACWIMAIDLQLKL